MMISALEAFPTSHSGRAVYGKVIPDEEMIKDAEGVSMKLWLMVGCVKL